MWDEPKAVKIVQELSGLPDDIALILRALPKGHFPPDAFEKVWFLHVKTHKIEKYGHQVRHELKGQGFSSEKCVRERVA